MADDHVQGVTNVIRGEDHISNTPKQILIYDALGLEKPQFSHLPLIVDHERKKLSKRRMKPDEPILIKDFRALGFVPQAVMNGLAFLGWNPKTTTDEIFDLDGLTELFQLSGVHHSGACYDYPKLLWFNAQWLARLDFDVLKAHFEDWRSYTNTTLDTTHEAYHRSLQVILPKCKILSEALIDLEYTLLAPSLDRELVLKTTEKETVIAHLSAAKQALDDLEIWSVAAIKEAWVGVIASLGTKNGVFLPPLRGVLSGRLASLGPFEIAYAIGKDATKMRITRALEAL
jgi:glutamyl-tRNA synthetase